ncbi:MAG: hypothetical protein WD972_00265, partial [Candidatus Andersenbacteria bacterium]
TLRLENFAARRMLPRLLIAAIFINFSLIIGGLLIDASRVVMAIMVRALGLANLAEVGEDLLKSSQLIDSTFNLSTSSLIGMKLTATTWNVPLQALQATVVIWALAAGLVALTVGLFVRYIMLILLLIVSPMAYLAFAFPNAGGLAQQWWKTFLKYVLYGPIALFILMLLITLPTNRNVLNETRDKQSPLDSLLTVGVTSALCIAAVTAGKHFGYIGANAAVNFATKRGKQIAGGTARYGGAAAIGAARLADKTLDKATGGNVSVGRGYKSAQDFFSQRQKAKKKQDKDRQSQSVGTRVGERTYASPEKRKLLDRDRQYAAEATRATDATSPALAPDRLRNKKVAEALKDKQVRTIIDRAANQKDNDEQIEVIVRSPELAGKMDADAQNTLVGELKRRLADLKDTEKNRGSLKDSEKEERRDLKGWLKDLTQSISEAERRATSGSDDKKK